MGGVEERGDDGVGSIEGEERRGGGGRGGGREFVLVYGRGSCYGSANSFGKGEESEKRTGPIGFPFCPFLIWIHFSRQ